jgi:hypothetical protein
MVAKKDEASAPRTRGDGRRQLLVYLQVELIKELKRVAIDEGRPAYEIVEEAIQDWLRKKRKK